jgi:hypothetical protein
VHLDIGKSETPIRVKDCGLMRCGHMDLGIAGGGEAKTHRQIGDREFVRTGTHVVGDHETRHPKIQSGDVPYRRMKSTTCPQVGM